MTNEGRITNLETIAAGQEARLGLLESIAERQQGSLERLDSLLERQDERLARLDELLAEVRRDAGQTQRLWVRLCRKYGWRTRTCSPMPQAARRAEGG